MSFNFKHNLLQLGGRKIPLTNYIAHFLAAHPAIGGWVVARGIAKFLLKNYISLVFYRTLQEQLDEKYSSYKLRPGFLFFTLSWQQCFMFVALFYRSDWQTNLTSFTLFPINICYSNSPCFQHNISGRLVYLSF